MTQAEKKVINRAGIIPYYCNKDTKEIVMLFMIPSDAKYGGPDPQICKGKVELNETDIVAAFREGLEELGLFKGNVISHQEIPVKLGKTTFFIAEIADKDLFGIPHFETMSTVWLSIKDFDEYGRKIHRGIVRAGFKLMQAKLGE